MRLIPVARKDLLEENGIYYSQNTLYKMHSIGERPELFIKVGRKLFIIKERWDEYLSQALEETDKRAEKIRELRDEFAE